MTVSLAESKGKKQIVPDCRSKSNMKNGQILYFPTVPLTGNNGWTNLFSSPTVESRDGDSIRGNSCGGQLLWAAGSCRPVCSQGSQQPGTPEAGQQAVYIYRKK